MANTSQPIQLSTHQGDGETWPVEIVDAALVPVNLTGAVFSGKMKKEISDTVAVATFTFVLTNLVIGKFSFVLSAADSAALPVEKYRRSFVFDCQYTLGGVIETFVYGNIVVQREVTT